MKNFLFQFFLLINFLLLFSFFNSSVFAGTINFDKTSFSVNPEESLSFQINVDPKNEEIRSVDVYISYDSNYLQPQLVTEGNYFPTVTSNTSNRGEVYIAGMVDDPAVTKTGVGNLATVSFKALKNGTTTISLNCQKSKMIKADIDASNILECAQTPTVSITIGTGFTSSPTPTPPSSLPKSGIFDNMEKVLKPGLIFLVVGAFLKFIIL